MLKSEIHWLLQNKAKQLLDLAAANDLSVSIARVYKTPPKGDEYETVVSVSPKRTYPNADFGSVEICRK